MMRIRDQVASCRLKVAGSKPEYASQHPRGRGHTLRRSQFKERNYTLFQLAFGKSEHFIQRRSLAHIELSGGHPSQCRKMRAAAELLAKLVGDGADVGSFSASEPKLTERL